MTVVAVYTAAALTIQAMTRIDTPYEIQYHQHGGILQYVLRQLIG